ncbi:DUF2986 domain-containing protein [Psychrobium sp. 1_MG-2023]|uniref:DUF2986 domain-containing protein n=1 Tax=Psychrobium sp. 1_MG-2023 TaxID=3062624 RepID=UPI000C33655E|nr:DUF2986 domain-containing protein [Psychrobium sp. 1_MG-2023]MDP2562227.1 DUF2986 domain-containing protein [Psychrobium sp. 1_MG-2023]PKF57481.1 DUF2986 domain-containing protein [Alteromonadales bacterium alter-6D02]
MNRKKKIKSILLKKQKKKNAKLTHSNKPRYIAKADRDIAPDVDSTSVEQSCDSENKIES